jgi:hypothetical protein
MRFMAIQTPTLFGGIVNRCLVVERERPLELVVARPTYLRDSPECQLAVGLIKRQVAFTALDDPIRDGVPVGPCKITFGFQMTFVTKIWLVLFQQPRVLVGMNGVTAAAVDIVFRVNIEFLHVLLVGSRVTLHTYSRHNCNAGIRRICQLVRFGIIHVTFRVTDMATVTRNGGFGIPEPDLVDRPCQRFEFAVMTVGTSLADFRIILGRQSL